VDKGTGVPTIENALGVLRMLMADALRSSPHPSTRDGVRAPKPAKRRGTLIIRKVRQLATAVAGRDGFIVRFKAYRTEWGELAALTVGAVDLKRRRRQINGSYAEAGGQVVWKAPKTK
jgi:hypothetical protein